VCGAAPLVYRRAVRRALGALPGLHQDEEAVRILRVSVVSNETGMVVASQEFVLGTAREVITLGNSGRARMYVPEVPEVSRFLVSPDGTLHEARGFRRVPVLPGAPVRVSDKYSAFFEFELRPVEQAGNEEEEEA
jgi:hypothetical protein